MSTQPDLTAAQIPGDLESVFNTSEYFDTPMDGSSSTKHGTAVPSTHATANAAATFNIANGANGTSAANGINGANGSTNMANGFGAGPTLGEPTAAFDRLETLSPNENLGTIGNATIQQYINQANASSGASAMEGVTFTNGTDGPGASSTGLDTATDGANGSAVGGL